jgi:hypothetical protein
MGLCKNKSWYSSYSGVSDLREKWIRACIAYIKKMEYGKCKSSEIICPYQSDLDKEPSEQQPDLFVSSKEELIQFLERTLRSNVWTKTPFSLFYFGLGGLKTFVNHSDCDGYYSPSDCGNILETYDRIRDELKYICKEDFPDVEELMKIFQESVEMKSYVVFC